MVFGDICSSSSVCIATGGDGGPGGEGGRGGDTGDAFGGEIGPSGDCNAKIRDSSSIDGEPSFDQSGKNIGRDCTGIPAVMNTVLVMEIIAVMVEEEQLEAMGATLLSVTIEEGGTRASWM